MKAASRAPRPALRPFVQSVWYFEGPDLRHRRERVIPDGTVQLLVNLDEDELRWWEGDGFARQHVIGGAAVSGVYRGAIAIDTREQRKITGVCFRPGAAPLFLHQPADEVRDAHPELEDIWRGDDVRERLLSATSAEAVLDTWEHLLLERMRGAVDRRVAFAIDGLEAGRPVREVAAELGWSHKRLRQRFAAQVGLFPKRFARIRRLQRVLTQVAAMPPGRWAQLAVACGFHDQAHLIRDFRELVGVTPTRYVARDPGDLNHVVLD